MHCRTFRPSGWPVSSSAFCSFSTPVRSPPPRTAASAGSDPRHRGDAERHHPARRRARRAGERQRGGGEHRLRVGRLVHLRLGARRARTRWSRRSQGFDPLKQPIVVRAGEVDLRAARPANLRRSPSGSMSWRRSTVVPSTGTLTSSEGLSSRELEQIVRRRRSAVGAAAAGQRDPGAGRRQHQGRPAQPGGGAARSGRVRRSGDRPLAGRAAGRCDRFGDGAAESVCRRVRPLLVRPGADSDAAGRRSMEDPAQQPRAGVPHQARSAVQHHRPVGVFAAVRVGRAAGEGSAVRAAGAAVPLSLERRAEPAAVRAAHLASPQLVHARRRQPVAAPLAGRRGRRVSRRARRSPTSARSRRRTRRSTRAAA